MAALNVIKSVNQKDSLGSYNSPVFIGAEQRFVGALRQSNNNNLEEQSILGLDCITTEYVNDNYVRIIKKEYRNENVTSDYYILDIEIYDDIENSSAYFDDASETLVIMGRNEATADSDTFVDVRKEILSYMNKNGEIVNISTKTIQKKTVNGVTTMQEVITNNL